MYSTRIMKIELLKKIRALTELSQAKFSKLFKKSPGWVQHVEEGKFCVRHPEARIYVKIAKKKGLNITENDLYD